MRYTGVTMRVLFVVAMALLLLPLPAESQEKADVAEFAGQALREYVQNVVTPRNVGGLGFGTVEEARMGELGEPLAVKMIGLADLKAYKPEQPVESIVRDAGATWFPVLLNDETRAQLEIVSVGGELVAGEFGSPITAAAVAKAAEMLPEVLAGMESDREGQATLLKIPVLAASFLHVEGSGGGLLVPAMVNPGRLGLEDGRAYPAGELLAKLHELAVDIDENLLQ